MWSCFDTWTDVCFSQLTIPYVWSKNTRFFNRCSPDLGEKNLHFLTFHVDSVKKWRRGTFDGNSRFINYGSANSLCSLASHLLSHYPMPVLFSEESKWIRVKTGRAICPLVVFVDEIERPIEGWIIGRTLEKNERIRTFIPRPRRATSTGQDERYDRKREE